MTGWLLLLTTIALVLVGCLMYAADWVGWAQLWFVLASGTAGAGIVMLVERRSEREQHLDPEHWKRQPP